MINDDTKAPEAHGDASADLIHDLSNDPPPKSLDTVKAASDAVEDDRRGRIERRAYELWQAAGGQHGSHEDHWHEAAKQVASEAG